MFLDILAVGFRLLGLSAWFERQVDGWQQRQQGRVEQQNVDLKAANEALRRQNQAQADAPTTRAELEEVLRKGEL